MPVVRGSPPAPFIPVIERLREDAERLFGMEDVRLVAEAHEDRPYSELLLTAVYGQRAVHPTSHLFVKIYKVPSPDVLDKMRRRIARDYETNCAVYQHLSGLPGLGTVRPLACYEDLLAIVTERAQGQTLLAYLCDRASWFPNRFTQSELVTTMESVGRWIRAFQAFEPRTDHVAVDGIVEYVDVRLRRLVESQVLDAAQRQRVLDRLTVLARSTPFEDLREVALHADLAPSNILVSAGQVTVLDFATAARGTYLHDISRLFMQVDLLRMKPQIRGAVIEPLLAALLRGLDRTLTVEHPLFQLLSILHHINHFGTLSLQAERFPGSVFSAHVLRYHRQWLERDLREGAVVR